jgi:2-C-methyl-D-erythritol 4-phosphate cytidylyltransferase
MSASSKLWVVIPAAGNARRMASSVPKQYSILRGRSVLEWSVAPFLARPDCAGVVIALAADDQRWTSQALSREVRVSTTVGGAERSSSVQRGLEALRGRAGTNDWVLVHDAARPCLSSVDLDRLVGTLKDDDVGGLLASAVIDTLKRSDAEGRVAATVSRTDLWRALTPQMFRYEVLERALAQAVQQRVSVTDEAQAVELLGLQPRLVAGSADNIKITVPEDLVRAEHILATMNAATTGPASMSQDS